ncbi:MAG: efflux RND transporter permease subunit, partial [Desulfuromusa sp.]|nr:efflux RND transporter permease subunit [Desulfuromusa sp.]
AIPFRSYTQPLLIMAAIPFGMIGAVLGHIIMGFNLSLLSLFGLVALSGVVINDSLLLIDKVNRNRREGMPLYEAIIAAGTRRFRPIVLTSLTTFFGLTPMILETSVQAQFLVPMAISLGFGILFGTGIILLLIPALYMILEDIRRLLGLKEEHARQHHEAEI